VLLGVSLPPRALVIHRVPQTVPVFVMARFQVPRAPVLVQVLESGQISTIGCTCARVRTPSTVVHSRPLQPSYTSPASSVVAYEFRSFTKKSDDSLVGKRQDFVVVQQAYDTRKPRYILVLMVPERVEVEPERVRRGRLGGFPPQLAHQGEVEAGLDALHVGEDHGRDVQAGIEGWSVRIGRAHAADHRIFALTRHGARARVSESWLFSESSS